jgi:hypothetical protein
MYVTKNVCRKNVCHKNVYIQRTDLQAKYGDEEYKKKHAKEIADARAKRKQMEN